MAAVTDFDLLSFPQLLPAPLSEKPLGSALVSGRTLAVRTRSGNVAKMHVQHAGSDLLVEKLSVYSFDACLLLVASKLKIRSGFSIDLDAAKEVRGGGDLHWRAPDGRAHVLEPRKGAALFAFPAGVGVVDIDASRHEADSLPAASLRGQPLHVRTRKGEIARLVVDAGPKLRVRALTVLGKDGAVKLDRRDIRLPAGRALDLETGKARDGGEAMVFHALKADGRGDIKVSDGGRFVPAHVYQLYKYALLLSTPKIRAAMVFEDSKGALIYDQWSEARKTQLREWLALRDAGQPLPISGPPALDEQKTMRHCSAWKIYLAHVVQSLWVDASGLVPWKLRDANAEALEHLLDSRKLLHFGPDGHKFSSSVMGQVTQWSPQFSWDFLVGEGLLDTSHWKTIRRVTDWVRSNLRHITGFMNDNDGGPFETQEDQWEYIFGYRGPPPVNRMIEPLPDRDNITHGCWGTDGFLAAVLRTANIPVRHGRSQLSNGNHSRAEFFSVGWNLCHGDDPYNAMVGEGVNNVPIQHIFMSNSELEQLIDAPTPLPGKTVGETASHNRGKFLAGLAVEYKTNWLLQKRCQDISSGNSTGPGSKLHEALGPYYSTAQINDIAQQCDAALAAISGGCPAVW